MTTSTTSQIKRGSYNEILMSSLNPRTRKEVQNLIDGATNSPKVDEHGSWEFGKSFDKKGRGHATSYDLYAVGRDIHSKRRLIILQIRQYVKQHKSWHPSVRKSYFLIGRNEDNSIFAHCVESRTVHSAISKGKDVIASVQSWIFGCEYSKVLRQGDIGLIPVKRVPQPESVIESPVTLQDSHMLEAESIVSVGGATYAKNPHLHHLPATHPDVSGQGWFKIVVGNRAAHWNFAAPTID